MKIFDFTNGTKGDLLGEAPLAQYSGGFIVVKDGTRFKVELTNPPTELGEVSWASGVGRSDRQGKDANLDPATYGVGAVIVCLGEWFHKYHPGHPEAESHWDWRVVGTTEWNREACRKGILKATKLGPAFPADTGPVPQEEDA